jgi:triacylglycerol esterase/lipase EstA (alpha/beta hydrolase family)
LVLVHGYMGHPAMFRPLIRKLYLKGWGTVRTVGYPSTRLGLDQIAARIDAVVQQTTSTERNTVLIGHSLGAVACRAYLKVFGGARFVSRFLSLGGPHAGTSLYRLAPPNLWPVLDPAGPWVKLLSKGEEPVPTVVIRARYDHQVLPPRAAQLAGAHEVVLEGHGHNGLLWADDAHAAVLDALGTP